MVLGLRVEETRQQKFVSLPTDLKVSAFGRNGTKAWKKSSITHTLKILKELTFLTEIPKGFK